MRLAILADVHANLYAFEAVLADIETHDVDHIAIAGDLINGGPHPNEVLARLADIDYPLTMIRGNHEDYVQQMRDGSAPAHWQARQWDFTRWTWQTLTEANLDFLGSLPEQAILNLSGCDPIRLVHGTPESAMQGLQPYNDLPALDAALQQVAEPVLVSGHTHVCYTVWRGDKLALNPGAVSAPFGGDWRAHYALLDWKGAGWQPQIRRVTFDREALAADMHSSGLMKTGGALARAFLLNIRHGVDAVGGFLQFAYQLAADADGSTPDALPDDIWQRAEREWHWDASRLPLNY